MLVHHPGVLFEILRRALQVNEGDDAPFYVSEAQGSMFSERPLSLVCSSVERVFLDPPGGAEISRVPPPQIPGHQPLLASFTTCFWHWNLFPGSSASCLFNVCVGSYLTCPGYLEVGVGAGSVLVHPMVSELFLILGPQTGPWDLHMEPRLHDGGGPVHTHAELIVGCSPHRKGETTQLCVLF